MRWEYGTTLEDALQGIADGLRDRCTTMKEAETLGEEALRQHQEGLRGVYEPLGMWDPEVQEKQVQALLVIWEEILYDVKELRPINLREFA